MCRSGDQYRVGSCDVSKRERGKGLATSIQNTPAALRPFKFERAGIEMPECMVHQATCLVEMGVLTTNRRFTRWRYRSPRNKCCKPQANDQFSSQNYSKPQSFPTCITRAGAELGGIHAPQSLHVDVEDTADPLIGRCTYTSAEAEDAAARANKNIIRQAANVLFRQPPRTRSCQNPLSISFSVCLVIV